MRIDEPVQYPPNREQPTLRTELEGLQQCEGLGFRLKFFEIADKYDHEDLKQCGLLSSNLEQYIQSKLDWSFYRLINGKNFKFILGIACMLGGELF